MSLKEISETIDETAATLTLWNSMYGIHFSPSVNITGGEPFLRKDLFEILQEFHRNNFDLFVLTNGTIVDKHRAKQLSNLHVQGVQVSIEGPREIHESIRGKNSFTASLQGVKNLLEAGLEVTLNVTLSSLNAEYFTDLIQLSSSLGVQKLGFSRLVPSGRGVTMAKDMLLTERIKELYENIFSREDNGLKIVTGDPVASQLRMQSQDIYHGDIAMGGCAAGISGITILADGTIVPCRRLPVPVGNIKRDS